MPQRSCGGVGLKFLSAGGGSWFVYQTCSDISNVGLRTRCGLSSAGQHVADIQHYKRSSAERPGAASGDCTTSNSHNN